MSKKIELVALDIDGTIFRREMGVSSVVSSTIMAVREKGIPVMFCTGRWYWQMIDFCRMFGMGSEDLHVTCNGAVVVNTEGEVHHRIGMNMQTVNQFMDKLTDKQIGYGVCDELNFYTNKEGKEPHGEDPRFIEVHDDNEFKKLSFISKMYINAGGYTPYVSKLLTELPFGYASDFRAEFDVWPKETNKGIALLKVANYHKIPMENVMFIGDGGNDFQALKMAGLGIAMGQADEEVKLCADLIAPSCEDDGVAWTLHKYILNSKN